MQKKRILSFVIGFIILFIIYHFPEFFPAFWIMAICKIGFLFAAFISGRLQGFNGLKGYGLAFNKRWVMDLMSGLHIGLFFFFLSVFLSTRLGFEEITVVYSFHSAISHLPMILLMTAIPSMAEDILTRGYVFAHLKFMKPFGWIVLSSVIYVLNHIWRLQDGPAVISYLFMLGMVLAYSVWITRSLWLAFGIHWGANIAFESGTTFFRTKLLVPHDGTTWLLAMCWALLLVLLMAFHPATIFKRK
jgi:membrane protease YdiL (CAAX protease family)